MLHETPSGRRIGAGQSQYTRYAGPLIITARRDYWLRVQLTEAIEPASPIDEPATDWLISATSVGLGWPVNTPNPPSTDDPVTVPDEETLDEIAWQLEQQSGAPLSADMLASITVAEGAPAWSVRVGTEEPLDMGHWTGLYSTEDKALHVGDQRAYAILDAVDRSIPPTLQQRLAEEQADSGDDETPQPGV